MFDTHAFFTNTKRSEDDIDQYKKFLIEDFCYVVIEKKIRIFQECIYFGRDPKLFGMLFVFGGLRAWEILEHIVFKDIISCRIVDTLLETEDIFSTFLLHINSKREVQMFNELENCKTQNTILHYACAKDTMNVELLRTVISSVPPSVVTKKNKFGKDPVCIAIENKRYDLMNVLFENGAVLDPMSNSYFKALAISKCMSLDVYQELFDAGMSVDLNFIPKRPDIEYLSLTYFVLQRNKFPDGFESVQRLYPESFQRLNVFLLFFHF
jgi:hypothetical protein